MKKTFTILSFLFFGHQLLAQQPDSLKKKLSNYYMKELAITEAKSNQVVSIMEKYKSDLKKFAEEQIVNPVTRKVKFNELVQEKNKKLAAILSDEQLDKILPSDERPKKN